MALIEIPDDEAAALEAKAAAQGLTLAAWLKKLADIPDESEDAIRRAQDAVQPFQTVRRESQPDPEGWTVVDYVHRGRRY
jgi:hypothetical protein